MRERVLIPAAMGRHLLIHGILVCWDYGDKLSALNNRNVFSYSSRGWKSGIKVAIGLVPSEGCEGNLFYFFPLTMDGISILWLIDGLPLYLHTVFLCVCL
jgi:hypothetical protein